MKNIDILLQLRCDNITCPTQYCIFYIPNNSIDINSKE